MLIIKITFEFSYHVSFFIIAYFGDFLSHFCPKIYFPQSKLLCLVEACLVMHSVQISRLAIKMLRLMHAWTCLVGMGAGRTGYIKA